VLIHGYIATADRHWINTGVFADLARDHRVIALDCRGHGKSDKPSEAGAYGAEMGRDVVRLLNHLQIRRAHLMGFSMGAFIVGHLLTTNPDRFLSATFVAHHPVRGWTTTDEQDAQASAQDLESDTPFRSLILGISPTETPPSEVEIRRLSQALVAANDPKALAAYHRGRHTLSVTDAQLAAVRVPTSAIIGNADPALAGVHDLKRIMPALSVTVIDGATHGGEHGVLRRSEFLTALRQFLNPPQSGRRAGLAFVRAAQSQERMLTIVAGIQRGRAGRRAGYLRAWARSRAAAQGPRG
jgi:pimeloyl-ACP methyl ester carboxylesterase